jgi:hypothetical protein
MPLRESDLPLLKRAVMEGINTYLWRSLVGGIVGTVIFVGVAILVGVLSGNVHCAGPGA